MNRQLKKFKLLNRAKKTKHVIKHPCNKLFEKDIIQKEDILDTYIKNKYPVNKEFIKSVSKVHRKYHYILSTVVEQEIFLYDIDYLNMCKYTNNKNKAMTFDSYEEAEKCIKKLNNIGNYLYFVIKKL